MAQIPGGVRFTGFVAPSDSTDTYPVIDNIYGKGGYREVANTTERDSITVERRREGMLVYVQNIHSIYVLQGGIENTHWQPLTVSSSDFVVPNTDPLGDIVAGKIEYDGADLYFSPSDVSRQKVLLETLPEGQNIVLGTVTGTQIGTNGNQKLGFFGATPVTQRGPYAVSNFEALRSLDARDLDLDQIGDFLGSLVEDLKALGLIK